MKTIPQPAGLISVLLDKTAREDERDDAAMDLANYPSKEALEALFYIASDPDEDDMVLDSCGESLGEIWVKLNQIETEKIIYLSASSFESAKSYVKHYKPEWLIYFEK